jgi:hypothetical protein
VLEALLWRFHNSRDGRCFPSYEAIAAKAGCCRDTVYRAIQVLEAADVLSWVNRIIRERVRERDLFGNWCLRWRVIRTSNAYVFRDPLPCAEGQRVSESESRLRTQNQISLGNREATEAPVDKFGHMGKGLLEALRDLGEAIARREGVTVT